MAINILLVEDTPVAQKIASITLTMLGHKVTVAGHGKQALEIFKNNEFDFVLMDLKLPDTDGISLTKTFRTINRNQHIPIFALTAHDANDEKMMCLTSGMNDYFVKPLTEELAIEIIGKLEVLSKSDV